MNNHSKRDINVFYELKVKEDFELQRGLAAN